MKLIDRIVGSLMALKSAIPEWRERHLEVLEEIQRYHLPGGSGFDRGTRIDLDKSTPERVVFTTSFHHMDENGHYNGWTDHTVVVTPSFVYGVNIRVTGRNKNNIKEYIDETFRGVLLGELP